MNPGAFALGIYRGDSHAWDFALWGDREKTQPVDLTGVAVKAEIRAISGGTPITPIEVTVTLPNLIRCTLSPEVTRDIPVSARWDLQLTEPGVGRVSTVLAGPVKVQGDITDSDDLTPLDEAPRSKGYLIGEPL